MSVPSRRRAWATGLVRFARRKPLGAMGAAIILLIGLLALFADVLAPYGFREQNLQEALLAPGAAHLFGTDQLGRDVFSRVVYGARISLTVAFVCVAISTTSAVVVGLVSGYFGGRFDTVLQRVIDAFMTIPDLVFVLAIMAVFGRGLWNVIFALSAISFFWNARVIRGEVLHLKENAYVDAAHAMGASHLRVMFRHVLPNAVAPIIILATIRVGTFILGEASISFLGFGIPPPFPTWGGMLTGTGVEYMYRAPWVAIWPGLALSLTVFGFNVFGDALRDVLDPRLRGSR